MSSARPSSSPPIIFHLQVPVNVDEAGLYRWTHSAYDLTGSVLSMGQDGPTLGGRSYLQGTENWFIPSGAPPIVPLKGAKFSLQLEMTTTNGAANKQEFENELATVEQTLSFIYFTPFNPIWMTTTPRLLEGAQVFTLSATNSPYSPPLRSFSIALNFFQVPSKLPTWFRAPGVQLSNPFGTDKVIPGMSVELEFVEPGDPGYPQDDWSWVGTHSELLG